MLTTSSTNSTMTPQTCDMRKQMSMSASVKDKVKRNSATPCPQALSAGSSRWHTRTRHVWALSKPRPLSQKEGAQLSTQVRLTGRAGAGVAMARTIFRGTTFILRIWTAQQASKGQNCQTACNLTTLLMAGSEYKRHVHALLRCTQDHQHNT